MGSSSKVPWVAVALLAVVVGWLVLPPIVDGLNQGTLWEFGDPLPDELQDTVWTLIEVERFGVALEVPDLTPADQRFVAFDSFRADEMSLTTDMSALDGCLNAGIAPAWVCPDIAAELGGETIYEVLTDARRMNLVDELLVMEAPNATFTFRRSG